MMLLIKHTIIASCLTLVTISAHSQQNEASSHKSNFNISFGYGTQDFMKVTYHYTVRIFQLEYGYSITKKENWSLDLLAQTQVNTTTFRKQDEIPEETDGFEYGLHAGLRFRKVVVPNLLSCYLGGSIGPHYISDAPIRQTPGFIFSDNLFLGMTARLANKLYLDVRPTFRHISNANLVKPNKGINNFILNVGLSFRVN
jgi:hypothetical protein